MIAPEGAIAGLVDRILDEPTEVYDEADAERDRRLARAGETPADRIGYHVIAATWPIWVILIHVLGGLVLVAQALVGVSRPWLAGNAGILLLSFFFSFKLFAELVPEIYVRGIEGRAERSGDSS